MHSPGQRDPHQHGDRKARYQRSLLRQHRVGQREDHIDGVDGETVDGAGRDERRAMIEREEHIDRTGAVNSLAINTVNVIFALTYAMLAQKRSLVTSLSVAMLVWVALAWTVHEISWTVTTAVLLNIVVVGVCIFLARPLRHVPIPRMMTRWTDLAIRAGLVALLVGVTVTLSFRIGPGGSGILAVFPVILLSIMFILHRRVGGKPAAAVMANAVTGLVGFAFACVMLHYTAEPLGWVLGLTLALSTSVAWGLIVYNARKRGIDL